MRLIDVEREEAAARDAALQETARAMVRVADEPPEKWRASRDALRERLEKAEAGLAEAEAAFREASRSVARGDKGANAAHDEAHSRLIEARGEREKAAQAHEIATAECAESEAAQRVVDRHNYLQERRAEYETAKERGRLALAAHVAALEKLRESDAELRAALAAVGEGYATFDMLPGELNPLNAAEITYRFGVCYVDALPVKWRKGEYDLFRAGFVTDPNSSAERTVLPSFEADLSPYLQAMETN